MATYVLTIARVKLLCCIKSASHMYSVSLTSLVLVDVHGSHSIYCATGAIALSANM